MGKEREDSQNRLMFQTKCEKLTHISKILLVIKMSVFRSKCLYFLLSYIIL